MSSIITDRLYPAFLQSHHVTTDSRAVKTGSLFFALKGERVDGHSFVERALQDGAALCVISNPDFLFDDRCVLVPDVLATLQDLARHHRQQLSIPFIGITGTNGKTTTKELTLAVLSRKYRTHATAGNFNNHLGVPLTILAIPPDAEVAIIEMGASHPGEIDTLCAIAQPDFGLITNVGKAHLEGFGSFEGVVHTKTELYRFLAARRGTIFVNADDDLLFPLASQLASLNDIPSQVPGYIPGLPPVLGACNARRQLSVVTYGGSSAAEVKGVFVAGQPLMQCYLENDDQVYTIHSHLFGHYNFYNAMAAAAVGVFFGVDFFDIKEALEAYLPSNNRSQIRHTERNTLILDCYNASPSSMKVVLDDFDALQAPHKVALLGGMKELGSASLDEHRTVVHRAAAAHLDLVALVGPEFEDLAAPGMLTFPDVERAVAYFSAHPLSDATILVKGSNGTRMWLLEKVL